MSSTLAAITEFGSLLDGLALTACLLLLLLLASNRLRYGGLYLGPRSLRPTERGGGGDNRTPPSMSRPSRQAYENLQRALRREFEKLLVVNGTVSTDDTHVADDDGGTRGLRYRQAREMLREGADETAIQQRCNLLEGELDLLRRLCRFAEEDRIDGPAKTTADISTR